MSNHSENDYDTGHVSNFKDHQYDLLAEHFRAHLDMDKLFKIAGFDKERPLKNAPSLSFPRRRESIRN